MFQYYSACVHIITAQQASTQFAQKTELAMLVSMLRVCAEYEQCQQYEQWPAGVELTCF